MKMNKNYVAPQISVVFVETCDVVTVSPGGGFDTFENYMNDVFLK